MIGAQLLNQHVFFFFSVNDFVLFFFKCINTHRIECVNLSQAELYGPILCKNKWCKTPWDRQPKWAEYRRLQNTVALWNSGPIQPHSATFNPTLSNCITPHPPAFHPIPPSPCSQYTGMSTEISRRYLRSVSQLYIQSLKDHQAQLCSFLQDWP